MHFHIIFILGKPSKSALQNPENIHKLIYAEIPGESEASIRKQVLKRMIHRSCSGNPTDAYKKPGGNGSCSKSFLKRFRQTTGSTDTDHYVEYQRRGGLIGLSGDEFQVDNRWVFLILQSFFEFSSVI